MKANSTQLAQALYDAVAARTDRRREIIKQFLQFIQKRRLKKLLPLVIKKLDFIEQRKLGIARVTIETARPISQGLLKQIIQTLQKNFGLEKIKENIVINRDLIAGIKLSFGDTLIDGSAKTFYERLTSNPD